MEESNTSLRRTRIVSPEEGIHDAASCERILRSLPEWFAIETALRDYVAATDVYPTFLACQDEEVLAFLTLKQHFDTSWEIHCFATMASRRGQGLGRALLAAAVRWLTEQGVCDLHVKTLSATSESAAYVQTRRFYERAGFRPMMELPEYWSPDNPCLVMIRHL
ncbi:GNAT family N-acetyltransferase [Casimicrobium huifangae]|uniref:GNAT family N-acetyltransferase n=1 Tax=Casimicrobium huifangae TaxID=2591109 RepID=UPI00378414E1